MCICRSIFHLYNPEQQHFSSSYAKKNHEEEGEEVEGGDGGTGKFCIGNASQVPTTLNSANNPDVLNIPQKDCLMTSLMVTAPSLN